MAHATALMQKVTVAIKWGRLHSFEGCNHHQTSTTWWSDHKLVGTELWEVGLRARHKNLHDLHLETSINKPKKNVCMTLLCTSMPALVSQRLRQDRTHSALHTLIFPANQTLTSSSPLCAPFRSCPLSFFDDCVESELAFFFLFTALVKKAELGSKSCKTQQFNMHKQKTSTRYMYIDVGIPEIHSIHIPQLQRQSLNKQAW